MSSLLGAAAPAPTDPQVNGASLIHSDVNPAGAMCTYSARRLHVTYEFVHRANHNFQSVKLLVAAASKTPQQAR